MAETDESVSMLGQPSAGIKKDASKSPSRRGRRPRNMALQGESESEMETGADDASTFADDTPTESVDELASSPPTKKRRGRPPEPNSIRSRKKRAKEALMKEEKEKKTHTKVAKKQMDDDDEQNTPEEMESDSEESIKEMPVVDPRGLSYFQLFAENILRKLREKDPEEYFLFPVSPDIAPDYAVVIKKPMDFYTIQNKIIGNMYENLSQLREDVELICENAMQYNAPFTVYHVAAQKLSNVARFYLGNSYIEYLKYHLPFGNKVSREILGLPPTDLPTRTQIVPTEMRRQELQSAKIDGPTAKKLLADAPASLRKKLTTEIPKWPLGYLDNEDGAISLNIMTPTAINQPRKMSIGDFVGKLDSGYSSLLTSFEDAFPALMPSSYLNYEPFASFAPMYDTTWSTMNQRDSDLLIHTYGDRENAAEVLALREMVKDCSGHFLQVVDDMLDTLTNGEHTRVMETLKMSEDDAIKAFESQAQRPATPSSFSKLLDDIGTLKNIGLDVGYVDEIKVECGLTGPGAAEDLIERNGIMINDLVHLQNQRFTRTINNISEVPEPSENETDLVMRMSSSFQSQINDYGMPPREFVNPESIHSAMGINDEDDCDLDVLREFMDI